MPSAPPKRCKVCNGHRDDVGAISWRGKCRPCALRRTIEAQAIFHAWRDADDDTRRLVLRALGLPARGMGVLLVDSDNEGDETATQRSIRVA